MRWKVRWSGVARPIATKTNWRPGFRRSGADRSRLADELDGTLVKSRRLERANREIAEKLDTAIATIRSVLDAGKPS